MLEIRINLQVYLLTKFFFPAVPSQWKARALREEMRKHKSPVFGEADVHLQKPTRYSKPLHIWDNEAYVNICKKPLDILCDGSDGVK